MDLLLDYPLYIDSFVGVRRYERESMSVVAEVGRVERVNREVGGLPTNGRVRVNERVGLLASSRNQAHSDRRAHPD